MKRSKRIRLVLIGGLSAGAFAGCGPGAPPTITTDQVYTNNYFVPGVGYYHAPFRSWYSLPYNHFDPQNRRYFFGGQWGASPYQSLINASSPSALAVQQAEAQRTDIRRGGWGHSSGYHHIWS